MIIDAILFFNELDVLEIRLNELNSVVDKFVIVESLEPHGAFGSREAVLKNNWNIVQPFEAKIKYVMVPNLEPKFEDRSHTWPRENFHRNTLMAPILEVASSTNDIVMISDCDEIPKASTVARSNFNGGIYALTQDFFYYNVNNHLGKWHGTVVGTLGAIQAEGGPQAARNRRDSWSAIDDGGWHFSYFGGIDKINHKVKNFAHSYDPCCQEFLARDSKEVARDIVERKDLFHRPGENTLPKWDSADTRIPQHFLSNAERYRHFTEEYMRESLRPLL